MVNVPDESKIIILKVHLKGAAEIYFESLENNEELNQTYNALMLQLKTKYVTKERH